MRLYKILPLLIVLFLSAPIVFAQGGYEDLLYQEVEVENPVYMPVLGLGAGVINYYGELQNDYRNMIQGQPAYRINVYQYIDNKHFWKININATFGNISGYERSFEDTSKNLNFKSTLFGVGLNVEYSFGNIYKGERKIIPFISLGGEYISFSSKTDIVYKENGVALGNYVYYPDGTIRVGDRLVTRDYDYETDIRSWNPYVREDYDPSSFSIVADLGLDFKVSDRVALRLASSLHYTFTDDIDGVSFENTVGRIGVLKIL